MSSLIDGSAYLSTALTTSLVVLSVTLGIRDRLISRSRMRSRTGSVRPAPPRGAGQDGMIQPILPSARCTPSLNPSPVSRSCSSTSAVTCSSKNARTWSANSRCPRSSVTTLKSMTCSLLSPASLGTRDERVADHHEIPRRVAAEDAPALRPQEVQARVRLRGEPEPALHVRRRGRAVRGHPRRVGERCLGQPPVLAGLVVGQPGGPPD